MHLSPFFLYSAALRRAYGPSSQADEVHTVETEDGVTLAVARYCPRGRPVKTSPVLCVHGLGANHFNFDGGDEVSLARYLADLGYDCWLVDLRGSGESAVTGRWSWTFDDHVVKDIPPVLGLVQKVTGEPRVHWIGHSMGGMMLYAYLVTMGEDRIHSGVTLGSPVRFSPRDDSLHKLLIFARLVRLLPVIPMGHVSRLFAPLVGLIERGPVSLHMNVANVDWEVIRRAYFNITEHLAPGVVLQFFEWMRNDDFSTADGSFSYRDNLGRITTPLCVIAGGADRLVPVSDVREAYERVSSARKHFIEVCCERGFTEDYGHIDLIFGREARLEVFPHIAEWLAVH